MKGKIIDLNYSDASILLEDGHSVTIHSWDIPIGSTIGSLINLNPSSINPIDHSTIPENKISNSKLVDFF